MSLNFSTPMSQMLHVVAGLRHFGTTKSAQDISAQHNRRRSESRRPKSSQKKNELTLLYSALIKKNSCAKLIVLRLMVTRYIGNMITFCAAITLICQSLLQASYQRSITIKYCITVIAIQRSPAASIRSLFFFVSCENK